MQAWQRVLVGVGAGAAVAAIMAPGIRILGDIRKALANDPAAWGEDMVRFARQDRKSPPPPGVIVFTGSSSFTFWKTLGRDMAPLPAINRGFGGSRMRDVTFWAHRTVIPYHPRAVVVFAGTNDIADPEPKSAAEVAAGFQEFVGTVRAGLPNVPIYYVSITPTPSRWKYWPVVQEANRLIRAYTDGDPRLHFIDLTPYYLEPDGLPDRSLYRIDRLHPNKKAYALWASVIRPVLMRDLGVE